MLDRTRIICLQDGGMTNISQLFTHIIENIVLIILNRESVFNKGLIREINHLEVRPVCASHLRSLRWVPNLI